MLYLHELLKIAQIQLLDGGDFNRSVTPEVKDLLPLFVNLWNHREFKFKALWKVKTTNSNVDANVTDRFMYLKDSFTLNPERGLELEAVYLLSSL